MVKLVVAVLLLPAASVAVTVMECDPTLTATPAAGLCCKVTGPTRSDVVTCGRTSGIAAWQFISASAESVAGATTEGAVVSTTCTLKAPLAMLPLASFAVHCTFVDPSGKVLPDGCKQVT